MEGEGVVFGNRWSSVLSGGEAEDEGRIETTTFLEQKVESRNYHRSTFHFLLSTLHFSRIAGLPYAAIPIATAISLAGNYPMIYPRKEVKTYGTKAEIEGEYHAGETVVVIDDLATTGGSKFEAIEKLTGAGLVVKDVVVLVDRQSGAKESLAHAGYTMHAVLTISQLLAYWEKNGNVEKDKIEETRKFLAHSQP